MNGTRDLMVAAEMRPAAADFERVSIGGQTVYLPPPEPAPAEGFFGRDKEFLHASVAWTVQQHPVLAGPSGTGKTEFARHLAQRNGLRLHIVQGHSEMEPTDLLIACLHVIDGKPEYLASGIAAAAIRGEAALLDECDLLNEKCWALLLPLLDSRRTVVVGSASIPADDGFRFLVTSNTDTAAFLARAENRLFPVIPFGYPTVDELIEISRKRCETSTPIFAAFRRRAQREIAKGAFISQRRALAVLRFATALARATDEDVSRPRVANRILAQAFEGLGPKVG